ncbi:MAG: hypothetical protein K1X88_01740 [Nannocystaceae bacterium]|nr:hypothetical protein [Nannocystaceae bacterium]
MTVTAPPRTETIDVLDDGLRLALADDGTREVTLPPKSAGIPVPAAESNASV